MRIAPALFIVAVAACAAAPIAPVPNAPSAPSAPVAPSAPKRKAPARRAPIAPAILEPAAGVAAAEQPAAVDAPAEEGVASYYADSLAGRRTANGERYRPEAATCAHRTHEFGTLLLVTVEQGGPSAQCRVNDRGPWVDGRIIDVSKSVARQLGMIGPGVLRVRVEVVEGGSS